MRRHAAWCWGYAAIDGILSTVGRLCPPKRLVPLGSSTRADCLNETRMKLGLGLYRHMLTRENFQFARQAGATHLVVHLVDYFKGGAHNPRDNQPTGTDQGWGLAGNPDQLWTLEELVALRKEINAAGLELEAIENFDPAHWPDILLDGPKKFRQLENVKTIIRRLGQAGI